MTAKEQGLPKLPEPFGSLERTGMWNGSMREGRDDVYDADQMRAYALAAIASDTGERGANRHIAEVLREYEMEAWSVADCILVAKRYVSSMPDSQVRCLLHILALRAQPAGGGEDWQARALEAEADIERMTDAFNRENGPTFMGEPVLPPEKMVELEPGVRVPLWLLDYAQRVELYMKANLPGPWRIGGIQSHDYANPAPPESGGQGGAVAWLEPYHLSALRKRRDEKEAGYILVEVCDSETEDYCVPLYTHPPAQASGAVTEAMVEAGLQAAVEASDARLARYSVVRAIITAALAQGGGNER